MVTAPFLNKGKRQDYRSDNICYVKIRGDMEYEFKEDGSEEFVCESLAIKEEELYNDPLEDYSDYDEIIDC